MAGFNSNEEYSTLRLPSTSSNFASEFNRAVPSPSRQFNSNTSQSRMRMPLLSMGQSASRAFGSRPAQSASSELDEEISRVRQFGDIATQRANALSAGELQANINRVKQYEPLANNEANRALGMNLATQFPYKKYESESTSAREIMNNAQSAIPTFLNRATAARLSPVSMSL